MPKTVDLAKKILINNKVKHFVDLNTDLGQTRDQAFYSRTNHELLNTVTSVSIPCAVHDGAPREILESIRQAKRFNCTIGAHIGYPDPGRFGYEPMQLDEAELMAWIYVQIGAFQALVRSENMDITHIRPHGALYTALINNVSVGLTLAKTLRKISSWLTLVGPAGPVLTRLEEETGLRTAPEIYLGKRYTSEGHLSLNRIQEFLPPQGVMDQARQLIHQSSLVTENGKNVPVKFKTLHISPALPQCLELAERVSQLLIQPTALPLTDIGGSGWL